MVFFRQIAIGVVFLLLMVSCSKEVSTFENEIPLGEITLRKGTPSRVSADLMLMITYIEDNRCPIGEVCSTPGSVNVSFKAYSKGNSSDFSIRYYSNREQCADTFLNHRIEITDLSPFRYANQLIDTMDYRIVVLAALLDENN
ncbi:hypothetical protein [Roseimarinus sediminis]|uniref:hypothetical protein n=1 Tax=Roseimarinus sediminis TaxID=1610899 RepID=UPI003D224D5D